MRTLSAFVLALAVAAAFTTGAFAGGEAKKHPGFWIKYENLVSNLGCFVHGQALFCPYDANVWRRSTTLITEDLPPASERVYVNPSQLKLSKK